MFWVDRSLEFVDPETLFVLDVGLGSHHDFSSAHQIRVNQHSIVLQSENEMDQFIVAVFLSNAPSYAFKSVVKSECY